jgi:hypothetical protein
MNNICSCPILHFHKQYFTLTFNPLLCLDTLTNLTDRLIAMCSIVFVPKCRKQRTPFFTFATTHFTTIIRVQWRVIRKVIYYVPPTCPNALLQHSYMFDGFFFAPTILINASYDTHTRTYNTYFVQNHILSLLVGIS